MSATQDLDRQAREAFNFAYPAKGGCVFFLGAMVALDTASQCVAPVGVASGGEKVLGIVTQRLDTTAEANGAQVVRVRRGCFGFPVTPDDEEIGALMTLIGSTVNAIDDELVGTDEDAEVVCGIVRDADITGQRLWVEI